MHLDRRRLLAGALAGAATLAFAGTGFAQNARMPFPQWVAWFRHRALARGVSAKTYDHVMGGLKPDTSVYALQRAQPEFQEATWQYLFRRVSDWRIRTGKATAKEHAALLARIEREYGVDRYLLLALWAVESAYGDPLVQRKYMRPVFPALAALAWGEPRRRPYWERELLNALIIVERRWSTPEEMRGSWAGAMGHTQWMPEVWLNVGIDFDRDNRVSPFGSPADALASTARYLVERGKYRRGEHWGYERLHDHLTVGVVRIHRGDIVKQLKVELLHQFVDGRGPQIRPHFADHEFDRHPGLRAVLIDGGLNPLFGVFQFHAVSSGVMSSDALPEGVKKNAHLRHKIHTAVRAAGHRGVNPGGEHLACLVLPSQLGQGTAERKMRGHVNRVERHRHKEMLHGLLQIPAFL